MAFSHRTNAASIVVLAVAAAVASTMVFSGHDTEVRAAGVAKDVKVPSAPPATAYIGAPDDASTWRLPIQAYVASDDQERFADNMTGAFADRCMAAKGYEEWHPVSIPDIGGKTLTDWRYGIHDPDLTARRGYHPPAGEEHTQNEAIYEYSHQPGADTDDFRSCMSEVDGNTDEFAPPGEAELFIGDTWTLAQNQPKVKAAFKNWSRCMKAKGYTYAKPMDANDDPKFATLEPTQAEIETAMADVTCRTKYDVNRVWFDAEIELQMKAIGKHQKQLDELRDHNNKTAEKAARLASR